MDVDRRRRGAVPGVLALACAVVAGGCSSEAPLPPRPAAVNVSMTEYRFDHGEIPKGRVVFRIQNSGRLPHQLALLPLPPDLPPIKKQLLGESRQILFTQARIPDTPPGKAGAFAVDLAKGRYAIICFRVEPGGISHAREGMASEFRVT